MSPELPYYLVRTTRGRGQMNGIVTDPDLRSEQPYNAYVADER